MGKILEVSLGHLNIGLGLEQVATLKNGIINFGFYALLLGTNSSKKI